MKIIKINKLIPLSISIAAIAFASASWAAGTASGTDINNTATINYSVGGTAQTEIESSEAGNSNPGANNGTATTFKVDKKIDLLVTASTGTNVVPGSSAASTELLFTLINEGNSTETFSLTPSQVASSGTADIFDTSSCTVTSPASASVSLAADASQLVKVQCTIPASSNIVKNGAKSMVDLLAAATGVAETSGADDANAVDIVFADGIGTGTDALARNAKHSATNTYTVSTADLLVKKTSAVTKMKINDADVVADAKRIPGSTIEYTITVTNAAGAATATGIQITDTVPATLTVVGTPSITGGTSTTASATGNAVSTTTFNLAAGETATLTITATVN